jgi:hypothetical protein
MRTSLLALGGLVGVGTYLVSGDAPAAPVAPVTAKVEAPVRPRAFIPTPAPSLPSLPVVPPVLAEVELMASDEMMLEVHGLAPFEDESEFAMVFTAGGELWMRIAEDAEGVKAGKRKMHEEEVMSVIAPVSITALPPELRRYDRMNVLVNGTCAARVDGFAKIARAGGEAGEGRYDDEGNYLGADEWTADMVEQDGYILAARLDGDCDGTWARSTQHAPAVVADFVDDPELIALATKQILAEDMAAKQAEWQEQGGEGPWQDAVEVTARSFQHPGTGEIWVFASATKNGGCGDPALYVNTAYRLSTTDGSLTRVASPEWAADSIRQVVDVDDDGEVEIVVDSYNGTDLVDMMNTTQRSLSVSYHSYGCGC